MNIWTLFGGLRSSIDFRDLLFLLETEEGRVHFPKLLVQGLLPVYDLHADLHQLLDDLLLLLGILLPLLNGLYDIPIVHVPQTLVHALEVLLNRTIQLLAQGAFQDFKHLDLLTRLPVLHLALFALFFFKERALVARSQPEDALVGEVLEVQVLVDDLVEVVNGAAGLHFNDFVP